MANVQQRNGKWWVRWKEPIVTVDEAGVETKSWKDRSRTFDSREAAKTFAAEREVGAARGERFVDAREAPTVTLKTIATWFGDLPINPRTKRTRKSLIKSFTDWAGEDTPATELSARLLERYAATLPSGGRAAVTRHRKVSEVERMWKAAYDTRYRDRFPGVPEPTRITADGLNDINAAVQPAQPVVRTALVTFDDIDTMREFIGGGWRHKENHRRVALFLRYTGLRIAQAVNFQWRDVYLDGPSVEAAGPYLVIRAGSRGAKKGRTRCIPLHPGLAAEMAKWGVREGSVFTCDGDGWTSGETTREAFQTAWKASKIDESKWAIPKDKEGARGHGTPTHAFRSAVFTRLLMEGVAEPVAQYLIGHATASTQGAYVPEATPSVSPIWPALKDAVAKLPDHRAPNNVRRLPVATA